MRISATNWSDIHASLGLAGEYPEERDDEVDAEERLRVLVRLATSCGSDELRGHLASRKARRVKVSLRDAGHTPDRLRVVRVGLRGHPRVSVARYLLRGERLLL